MENVFTANYPKPILGGKDSDKPIFREALASVGGAYPLPWVVQTLDPLAGCVPCVNRLSIRFTFRSQAKACG